MDSLTTTDRLTIDFLIDFVYELINPKKLFSNMKERVFCNILIDRETY